LQWGAVPLKTTPSTTVELEFKRADPKDVYAQIIADFTKAKDLLPTGELQPVLLRMLQHISSPKHIWQEQVK
jgi:hypothetical protein